MSQYCFRTGTRTDTSISTTFIRSTSFQTSIFTAVPTGTQVTGRVITSRIPSVTSFPTEITRRTTYYKSTCTTYRTSGYTYPNYSFPRARLSTGLIVVIVLAALWYTAFFITCIYLLCFSPTAKRGRRPKGQGFSQTQYQAPQLQQQQQQQSQYTPVPQDPLYSQADAHYPPPSNSPYGGLNSGPQNFNPYQNYNAPPVGVQGPQWTTQNPASPAAASFASGPGPGYIPPGAANPIHGSPSAGTISYSMNSTTPSPPPQGASDPHRLLYTQQNDRLSAAVSLVHPYQQSQEQPPSLSSASYPMYQQSLEQPPLTSSYPPPGTQFGQPQQTPSQTQLSAQYRGYAEPSTVNQNQNYGRA